MGSNVKNIIDKIINEVQKKYPEAKEILVGFGYIDDDKKPDLGDLLIYTKEGKEYIEMQLADKLDREFHELRKIYGNEYNIDVIDREVY